MRIASDFHLGLERKTHTTKASRDRLKIELLTAAENSLTEGGPTTAICTGDLFDTFSNSEVDIMMAAYVARHCDVILAGNHDLINHADAKGSLDVLDELLPDTVIVMCEELGESLWVELSKEGMYLAFVPHHASQELFDKAIERLIKDEVVQYRAIFLHCNYENDMAVGSDTSLNLTKEQAQKLLTVSDYVFLGHEHQPRELLDGRLVIVGNVHPTSFSDISDKYYWDLSQTELKKTKCWDMEEGAIDLEFNNKGCKQPIGTDVKFVTLKGKITADHGADLAQYIQTLWDDGYPLMVRNNVEVIMENQTDENTTADIGDLSNVISKELKGSELEEKWDHYRGIAKC